ncbi:ribose-phosphate pyrophosphokinase, putative [Perkinsus marinus ATCC 50983]|uniref:ribose-phosphate diphosphokinase n=1 Tax=Perkinsus marinus (strain ATCC 50983 / TXsc) TaxID=423536 RepID=C5L9E6_PERM5|nr:ribose-phosphate pyrophosphokinase, putative [Perkinsus marinus ATCC 50983]EER06627.1 ribose-phosphate pyrophosphokinase, putative [Perkinsus marinus ATCC 50983]|eukprot:XP_002774811.1 ribose-phosphate pyrophosphokinase, putative [Perkinsus marinus ATCC 50983]
MVSSKADFTCEQLVRDWEKTHDEGVGILRQPSSGLFTVEDDMYAVKVRALLRAEISSWYYGASVDSLQRGNLEEWVAEYFFEYRQVMVDYLAEWAHISDQLQGSNAALSQPSIGSGNVRGCGGHVDGIGHSFGTFVVRWMLAHELNRIASLSLMDPVCFLLVKNDLLLNTQRKVHEDPIGILATYLVFRELYTAHTLTRNFFWEQNNVWPEELRNVPTHVSLCGKDFIVPAHSIRRLLEAESAARLAITREDQLKKSRLHEQSRNLKKGREDLFQPMRVDWNDDGIHGEALLNSGWRRNILRGIADVISALRRASARSITLVTPYFAYARHMESEGVAGDPALTQPATPLAASDIALMYEAMGVDRIVTVDLHEGSLEGCFDVPVTNIDPLGLPLKYFLGKDLHNPVIVAPDSTASDRAFLFWRRLQNHGVNCGLATMVSNRKAQLAERSPDEAVTIIGKDGEQVIMPSGWKKSLASLVTKDWLVGDVEGRDCIIVDDIIDSAKRMSRTVKDLRQHGARRIYMYATHGVLSPAAMERINRRGVTEVVITNSLPFPEHARKSEKIRVLSLGQVLAEVMLRIYEEKSVSQMFWDNQKKEGSKRPSGTATV